MKLKHFFLQLISKLRGEPDFPEQLVPNLLRRLENTLDEELSCDEVLALVDVCAEASQRGEDVDKIAPLLRQHLAMCTECEEEYQALIQVLEGTAE